MNPDDMNMATNGHEDNTAAISSHSSSIVARETDASHVEVAPSESRPPISPMCASHPQPLSSDTMNGAGRRMSSSPIRAYSVQSNRPSAMVAHRSMSDLVAHRINSGTLEVGFGDRDRAQPSAFHHLRAGRYRDAANMFASHHRVYISVVTFFIMFGMTVAGLWLEIASQHHTVV